MEEVEEWLIINNDSKNVNAGLQLLNAEIEMLFNSFRVPNVLPLTEVHFEQFVSQIENKVVPHNVAQQQFTAVVVIVVRSI